MISEIPLLECVLLTVATALTCLMISVLWDA